MAMKFNADVNVQGQLEIGVANKVILVNTDLTASRTFTFPNYSGQLTTLAGVETLTNKTLTSPKMNEDVVMTATSTQLNDAVSKKHSQNTDTGTTAASWVVNSTGTTVNMFTLTTSGLAASRTLDASAIVDLTTVQTLTNKTLTSPKINEDVAMTSTSTELMSAVSLKHSQNTDTGTTGNSFTIDSDNATGKMIVQVTTGGTNHTVTLQNSLTTALVGNVILTLPNATDTLVGLNTQDTLTNKTLTTPTIGSFINANHNHSDAASGGTISYNNLTDKPSLAQLHNQNTDTGTTSATFALKSADATNGVLLQAANGELQIRDIANNVFADIRCRDFTVNGDITYLNTTDVFVKDTFMQLNASIVDNASNANAGIEVKRLDDETATGRNIQAIDKALNTVTLESGHLLVAGDYVQLVGCTAAANDGYYLIDSVTATEILITPGYKALAADQAAPAGTVAKAVNSLIQWDETNKLWSAGYNGLNRFLARRFVFPNGAAATTWNIEHKLGVKEVMVQIYDNSDILLQPDSVTLTDANNCVVTFAFVQDGYAVVIG